MLGNAFAVVRLCIVGGVASFAALAAPVAAAPGSALASAGLTGLSGIVDTLQRNDIDPFVATPGGAEPMAAAVVPIDSDLADQAAMAFQLRRLEPNAAGENAETMILPRPRPGQKPEYDVEEEKPEKPIVARAVSDTYKAFISGLKTIAKLRLDDPRNLARARRFLVKSDLTSLAQGWLAQCGEVAAQSQEFTSGVEKAASASGGADRLNSDLEHQPSKVMNISGWQNASLAIRKEFAKDLALMNSVAYRLSEIAYGRTGAEAGYAAQAKRGNPAAADPKGTPASALQASSTLNDRSKPLMAQMLALGAHLHLSNQNSVSRNPTDKAMATNRDNDQCLRWAQLNLAQCMAAARDNQERAYCLGKQGIEERAKCWSWLVNPAS